MKVLFTLLLISVNTLLFAQGYSLPTLPYSYTSYEPYVDAQTMEIHHSKHHQAYVDNLNKAVAGTPNEGKTIEELVKVGKETRGSPSTAKETDELVAVLQSDPEALSTKR